MGFRPDIGGGGGGRETVLLTGSPFTTLAALETYSSNNPNELLNNETQVALAVVTSDPVSENNGTLQWSGVNQQYAAGGWAVFSGLSAEDIKSLYESNANTNAFEDPDLATVSSAQSLSANSVPISNGSGILTESLTKQDGVDGVMVDGEISSTRDSINIGEGLTLSEDGGAAKIIDRIDNLEALPMGTILNTDGTTGANIALVRDDLTNAIVQPDFSSNQVGDWVAWVPVTTTRIIRDLTIKHIGNATGVRLVLRDSPDQSTTDGIILFQSQTESQHASGEGLNFTDGDVNIPFPNGAKLVQGRFVYVQVIQNQLGTGDINLRGNVLNIGGITQFYAYLEQETLNEDQVQIATHPEINASFQSLSRNDAITTFTDFEGNNTPLVMSDIIRSLEDLGEGATGGNFSLDNISNSWLQFHPDSENVASIIIPNTTDIGNDSPWVFDFSLVNSNIPITVQKDNTEFRGGDTTLTLLRNHVLLMWSHVRLPNSPISPTNPLVIYHMQMPANGTLTQPFKNTVVISNDGDDSLSGVNYHQMVQTMTRALSLAGQFPSGQHKLIHARGENQFGPFTNNLTNGNVANLNIDSEYSTFTTVTLADHATSIKCRVITSSITIGDQCKIEVGGTVGSASPSTVIFNSETHNATEFKCQRMQSTVTIDFSGIASGSTVRVEVDKFDGTESQILSMIDAIPENVNVSGWIGGTLLPYDLKSSVVNESSDFTVRNGGKYAVNTSGGEVNALATGNNLQYFSVFDSHEEFNSESCVVDFGGGDTFELDTRNDFFLFYKDSGGNWRYQEVDQDDAGAV